MITICRSSFLENENSRKFDKIGQGNDKNAIIILIYMFSDNVFDMPYVTFYVNYS